MTTLGPESPKALNPGEEYGPGEPDPGEVTEPGQAGEASQEQGAVTPQRRYRVRARQWFTIGLILVGTVCAIIGPTLHSDSDTPAEFNFTSWLRPAGLVVIALGIAVIGLDYLFQREQNRAKKVVSESPIIYNISGERIHFQGGYPISQQAADLAVGDTFMARQERMLEDSYIQTISQAKVIFWVSQVFMCLGGLILLGGALSAVYSGGNSGKVEAGIVTAVSGALANLASATFLYQANKSRSGLADQAASMQARSIVDRRVAVIREIASGLGDEAERVSSLKELMSTLARSIDHLDAGHGTDSTESTSKSNDAKS